jgi:signal transduction histidine kinase
LETGVPRALPIRRALNIIAFGGRSDPLVEWYPDGLSVQSRHAHHQRLAVGIAVPSIDGRLLDRRDSGGLGTELWSRLVRAATSHPDPEETLSGLVVEGASVAGATAGVIVQLPTLAVRACWGCQLAEVQPLLAANRPLGAALARAPQWRESPLWLPLRAEAGSAFQPGDRLLLVPMQMRGVPIGALALFLPDATEPPPAPMRDATTAIAGLAAMVLENERLFEEGRQAQQLRDDFVTAINHEMRTPATAFVLDAFMMRSGMYGALPPALDKQLQQIETHLEAITHVLEGVLSLNRQPGTGDGYGEAFQPRQVVLNLLRRVEPAAKRKNLPILFFAPRTLPMIQLDMGVFSRVLLHLLSNAVKYTTEGRIEVRLEQASRSLGRQARERVLVVRVADTGCGIPSEHLSRIFEPCAQVDEGARTDSRTRGLGLGLSIAQKLARGIRGDVTLESEVGQGTTVTLTVPYHH